LRGRDRDLLVDAGNGVAPLAPALPAHDPARLIVVATHAHADHAGGLAGFGDVRAHVSVADALRRADPDATLAGPGYALEDLSGLVLPPPGLSGPLADARPAGFDPSAFGPRPLPAVTPMAEGDVVDLGDRRLVALHLPGHSPGCMALWDEGSGLLVAGDVIYEGGLVVDLHHSDPPRYRASLTRLLARDPALVLPGHGDAVDGAAMRRLIRAWLDG
jgi:glyoxylase-like metal-dependent hydrolase (beta-lactamase superfamily II)